MIKEKTPVEDYEHGARMFTSHRGLASATDLKAHRRNLSVQEHEDVHRRTANYNAAHAH